MTSSINPVQTSLPNASKRGAVSRTAQSQKFKPLDLTRYALQEELFLGMLCLERKRAERSGNKFSLVLVDIRLAVKAGDEQNLIDRVIRAVDSCRRETDLVGWYQQGSILGVLFTELGEASESATSAMLRTKIAQKLATELTAQEMELIRVSLHIFDDDSDDRGSSISNPAFYPDFTHQNHAQKLPLAVKRVMDVLGAAIALLVLSPVFFVIALSIRFTSKGSILFRQQRIGQGGIPFEFLKFRSMYVANSSEIHQTYVRDFIAGKAQESAGDTTGKTVFKIKNDPRVTRVGRFLRRTSLDELPQFWNVLRGDMSLVGPRPPVPYEIEAYYVWHRRRVLEAKPGITGLWQVHGRSKTTFDQMVRLDLQYAKKWSPLLDVKILLQTPGAVLSGDGAY
jgi:exopolysaccharide biosynthesis polyprenyl glycosylphosphotransferase